MADEVTLGQQFLAEYGPASLTLAGFELADVPPPNLGPLTS